MKKLRIIIVIVVVAIISIIALVIFSIKHTYENILIENLSKELTDFFNEGIISEHIPAYGKDWFDFYVKNDVANRYDITDLVEDYIKRIEECFDVKSDGEKQKIKGYKEYNNLETGIGVPIYIYGIKDHLLEYVIKAIPEEDMEEYRKGHYREMMVDRLSKVLEYKNNHWYLDSYDDKIIELPYNTYIDYKSAKLKSLHKVKHINYLKIKNKEIQELDKNNKDNEFIFNYTNYEGKDVEIKLWMYSYIDNDNYKFHISNLTDYYADAEHPAHLDIGSHDLDRQREEDMRTVPNFSTAELNRADEIWARVNKKMEVESALPEEEHTGFWKWLDEFNKNKSSFSEAEKETALDLLAQKSDEMRESMFAEEESIYESELAEANEK